MHGPDGAAGYRIETCRLCACTAPGGLGRSAHVAHHQIATWAWPRFHKVLAPAATVRSRVALARVFLPKL